MFFLNSLYLGRIVVFMNQKKKKERQARWAKLSVKLHELFPEQKTMLNYSNLWELVVAVALSAQTTDKQVNKLTKSLFKKYPTLENYCNAILEEFQQDINSVNYYKNKGRHIIGAAQKLRDEFNGKVPKSLEKLMQLPGVGRKTANVVQCNGFGIAEGIAVDTHVRRFAIRYDLTDYDDPTKIEQDLLEVIPNNEWLHAAYYMIAYGREIAPARAYDTNQDPLVDIYPKAGEVFRV